MTFEETIEIAAPAERIAATMIDVARWSEWTASITRIERLDEGPLRIGSRARVVQPKLMPLVWEVTALDPAKGFAWQAPAPGVFTVGEHWVAPGSGPGRCRVTLTIRQSGWLAPVIGMVFAGITRRYMKLEAEGLRARCEESSQAAENPNA